MAGKFRYPIFPDRIYTLTYEEYGDYEVSGEVILNYFRRSAMLEAMLLDLYKESPLVETAPDNHDSSE